MFKLGFSVSDLIRSAWVFAAAFTAVFFAGNGVVSKSLLYAAIAAGIVAVKNFVLANGSTAKG